MPMARYSRSELIPLLRKGQHAVSEPILAPQATQPGNTKSEPQEAPAYKLDDPTFAPADPDEVRRLAMADIDQPMLNTVDIPTTTASAEAPSPTGFRLSLDRQLLSRLLSDDSLCQEFEEARALTLDRQRDTGRTYVSLFREVIAEKPADVQAMLLNLLDDSEMDHYDRTYPAFA